MRATFTAALCTLMVAATFPAHAQQAPLYFESSGTTAADATYFYQMRWPQEHEKSVILVFNNASARLDGAAAVSVTQSIDCTTGRISTRYASFGDNGELLREATVMPGAVAAAIGSETWTENLRSSCGPPTPQPIPVAIDPPTAPDRDFSARVRDAAEAIAALRARTLVPEQAATLTEEGRWGGFTRDRYGAGTMIDYARSEAGHMAYLAYAGPYERDWLYARARYSVDCAAQTTLIEYFVTYNFANEIVDILGPTQQTPIGSASARDALTAFCASQDSRGITYDTVADALAQIRRETTRR